MMLSTRVKAAFVFVPLTLFFIYLGGWAFNLFILAVLLFASYEYVLLFQQLGHIPSLSFVLLGVGIFTLQRWIFGMAHLDILLTLVLSLAVISALVAYESGKSGAALGFTINLAGIFYLGWVGSFFISARALPNGQGWMLTVLPATWLADMGAYFIGSWLGKRKMSPRLSPHKTWAGFTGAVITGTASGGLILMLWRWVGLLPGGTPIWQGILMGFALAILTPIRDLMVSLIKRTVGVKDTGKIIPGHGGILDRIDTWIWAAMLGYYLVRIFQD